MKKLMHLQGLKSSNIATSIYNEKGKAYLKNAASIEEKIYITKAVDGYCITRILKNNSQYVKKIKECLFSIQGIDCGGESKDDYFYCNENARIFCNLTIPLDYNRMDDDAKENELFELPINRKWCDPGVQSGRICSSPYQPFPAILLSNYKSKKGIICGSLSQEFFYHSFDVGHKNEKAYLNIYSSFKGIKYREIAVGEELVDIFYIGETNHADDINWIFDGYVKELKRRLSHNCGRDEINRHSLIWGSWNDGIYRDISEEMLIREARAVKAIFPTVEWFQIDDGYSAYSHENVDLDAHGIGVAYEGDEGVDLKKFPNGLRGYTDKIKEIGLRPTIWIGGFCPIRTRIYQEKPEWFIDYTYRVDWTQPLDVSQQEVRDYMCFALDKLVVEYGFEGVKHDFWSYAFEDRHNLLRIKNKSGYEYREWWHEQLRKRVTRQGYLQTGCDVSMGNPFIGKYFNNYRFGLDIGSGKWDNVKTTVFWSVAILSPHTGDLFIPNSDSIGLLSGLNEDDYMFVVNWQIITRTLVEISGRFSLINENNSRLKILKRAVAYLNNGEDIYFAKYDYRAKGEVIPEIIYINSAFDSNDMDWITVAVFNPGEEEKVIFFTAEDVGLFKGKHWVEFVWDEKLAESDEFHFILKPHQSILLKIKKI